MATANRQTTPDLMDELKASPHRFDFFEAVRRLECASRHLPRVGTARRLKEEPVRFGQQASLNFAPASLAAVEQVPGQPPRMLVNFMGLLGPNGPMPLQVTEHALQRRQRQDTTLPAFLDIFHHRMVSLFYRAWAVNQQAVSRDRPEDDRFAAYVASLVGIGLPSMRGRGRVPDEAKLHHSGHLACQSRHPEGLAAILGAYFGVGVQVQEFVGQWFTLPESARLRLGASAESATLGHSAVLGARMWDCQQRFRLCLGPMSLTELKRFLPGQIALTRLVEWVRHYVGQGLHWDVRFVLKAGEAPRIQLGGGAALGWTSWLYSEPPRESVDDLILRPEAG